jgi:hypothetical protein
MATANLNAKPLLVIGVLCAATQLVRADYLFSWQGTSNLFKASFEVTDAEMQSGANFTSSLFTGSISVTSPNGITYHDTGEGTVFGSFTPFQLDCQLWQDNNNSYVEVDAGPPNGMNGVISGNNIGEFGTWSFSYIPEPSVTALLALGGVAYFVKRRPLFSARRSR